MNAIELQQVGLQYQQYAHPRDALLEWLLRKPRHQVFRALQGIDLCVEQGGSVGLIGDNGAGKSTLLRVLAGNLRQTSGECSIQGRRAALLELGSGVHPEFSGLENARLGLALRGLDTAAVAHYLPQVLDFAELGDFIYQPVKTYSSGMLVRLVFAVAVAVPPDVLIVDEALSVGDQYFQKKSLDRMRAILAGGATLVFCSHNLYQVRELCRQAIWLEQGRLRMHGDAQTVVDAYQDAVRARSSVSAAATLKPAKPSSTEAPVLLQVALLHANNTEQDDVEQPVFNTGQRFAVQVQFTRAGRAADDVHVGIVIRRNDDIQCYGISTLHDQVCMQHNGQQQAEVCFVLEQLPLLSGTYCLEVWLIDRSGVHVYDARERCCPFRVQQYSQAQGLGLTWMAHHWETPALKHEHEVVS